MPPNMTAALPHPLLPLLLPRSSDRYLQFYCWRCFSSHIKILLKSKPNYSNFKLTTLFPKIFGSSCTLLAYVFFNVKNVLPLPRKTPANLPTWGKKKGQNKTPTFFFLHFMYWALNRTKKKSPSPILLVRNPISWNSTLVGCIVF